MTSAPYPLPQLHPRAIPPETCGAEMVLPSHLPEGISLPMFVGGALLVAAVIRLFSRRQAPPRPQAASSAPQSPLGTSIDRARAIWRAAFLAALALPSAPPLSARSIFRWPIW